MNKKAKQMAWVWLLVIFGGIITAIFVLNFLGLTPEVGQVTEKKTTTTEVQNFNCAVVPTYTYQAKDVFSTSLIGGTDEIKVGNNAPVTSLASPQAGLALQYWKDNSTYLTRVKDAGLTKCGANTVQADAYANASITLRNFDPVGNVYLTNGGGTNNITVGANELVNLEFSYQGQAKHASLPFGGCIAIEYPNTFASVSFEGNGVSSSVPCPYVWTYAVSSTSNTFRTFAVPAGFDADGKGDIKKFAMQMLAGSSNPSGTAYAVVRPANYYLTNSGEIVLGIEKDQNQDTTKTFNGGASFSFVIV